MEEGGWEGCRTGDGEGGVRRLWGGGERGLRRMDEGGCRGGGGERALRRTEEWGWGGWKMGGGEVEGC
jgi:hypothetical protein